MPGQANGPKADRSNGYDAIADKFMSQRSDIGVETIRTWSRRLPAGAAILDLGCGHGVPLSQVLIESGFELYGVDASVRMVEAFRRRFPQAHVAHETVEDSALFDRTFDAVMAVGLMFLLAPDEQTALIGRVASVLNAGGMFLFTSPEHACSWEDVLTGRTSRSLGATQYKNVAFGAGLTLVEAKRDEGDNYYFGFVKR